jgi:hypothetical protein
VEALFNFSSGRTVVRIGGDFHVPKKLHSVIDMITGLFCCGFRFNELGINSFAPPKPQTKIKPIEVNPNF